MGWGATTMLKQYPHSGRGEEGCGPGPPQSQEAIPGHNNTQPYPTTAPRLDLAYLLKCLRIRMRICATIWMELQTLAAESPLNILLSGERGQPKKFKRSRKGANAQLCLQVGVINVIKDGHELR